MCSFAFFIKKYLRLCGCSGNNFMIREIQNPKLVCKENRSNVNRLNTNLVFNETNNFPFSGTRTCCSNLIGSAIEKH